MTRSSFKTAYAGPERRREQRRASSERRDRVRWEPAKETRRKGHGRRMADNIGVLHR
jgi:hypothetical protein